MWHILVHFSVNGHSPCFHGLAIVNSATVNTGVYISFWSMFFKRCMPGMRLQGHTVVLFLVFLRNCHTALWCFPDSSGVKNLPAMQETQVQSLGWEDRLEEVKGNLLCILAWRTLWTKEPGGGYSPKRVAELDKTVWLNMHRYCPLQWLCSFTFP